MESSGIATGGLAVQ